MQIKMYKFFYEIIIYLLKILFKNYKNMYCLYFFAFKEEKVKLNHIFIYY